VTLIDVSRALSERVGALRFAPPVACVYNPLDYARASHDLYLRRYGAGNKEVLLLGMNPGPFGMAQTGVPFGDIAMVRDWLGIAAPVDKPAGEHPKRPVLGFECRRAEVSGTRLWGWARERFGAPQRFFERFFVANYCPLAFMEESGANRTPDKLPAAEQQALFAACDEALRAVVAALSPRLVVGVGAFAEKRARAALAGTNVASGTILHPSPASPLANKGWAPAVERQLQELGVRLG
jgi:single-strand selective monofunctional uracil DNA glycosylase